jgi:hypothetical protein
VRNIRKTAATLAATGIAALGAVAATGGVAGAVTNAALTGCSVGSGSLLSAGLTPSCSAGETTISNPTSFRVTVDPSFFTVLGGLTNPLGGGALIPNLGATVTWTLECSVDGGTVTKSGTLNATAASNSQTINLQSAVGSPSPNSCTFTNLSVTSSVSLNSTILGALGSNSFTFGVSATGDNGTPGAIWAGYPADADGAGATVCADVRDNGNHGAPVQSFRCESDLADQWIHVSTGQLVHNGDCLDSTAQGVVIDACQTNPASNSTQRWAPQNASGPGTLSNAASNKCLTAPTSGTVDGKQLTVATCSASNIGQQWHLPGVTPA